jgi:1,4-dihydroxy-2-naphthoate polyprenyltransferase
LQITKNIPLSALTEENKKGSRLKDIFLHLRLPFSYFLLPVYFFALSQAETIVIQNCILLFIALHFFIYPGSNLYNSFMDKDTGSIGALKNPPPATRDLYYASIFFDLAGLLILLPAGITVIFLTIIYILVSKAYSWDKTRIKKYPYSGWLVVILFQGGYTFMLTGMIATENVSLEWFTDKNLFGMLISTLLIGAYYPITQIYQHKQDSERGDFTISYKLGVNGTFIFCLFLFITSSLIALYYFITFYSISHFYIFIISLLPAILFFLWWFKKSIKNQAAVNFENTMRMTAVSSTCMLVAFIMLLVLNVE